MLSGLNSYVAVYSYTSLGILSDAYTFAKEQKRATEDEKVEQHHQLSEHEFEQILRDGEGQGSLECCNPQGRKESDMTE